MKQEKQTDASMSLSKQRKIQRQKEILQQKRRKKINKIIGFVLIAVVVIGACSYGGYKLYREANKLVADSNFSKYLEDNGHIKGVNTEEIVKLCDYKNIKAPLKDIEYSDEKVEKDIQDKLEQYPTLDKKATTPIANGDSVNIDYVGTVDGKEFEGGNTNGAGTKLEIGSNQYIDNFEEQLIGHKAGDKVTVNVTFPEKYDQNPALANKPAVFEVTINGIYKDSVFDDEFVKTNLSSYATTAEGYKKYLKDTNYEKNLEKWLQDYVLKECSITSYPEKYVEQVAATSKYNDQMYFEQMKQYFGASAGLDTFSDYTGKSDYQYEKDTRAAAKTQTKEQLIYQAILEKEGINVTIDEYKDYLLKNGTSEESYKQQLDEYGTGYMVQQMIKVKALEILKQTTIVE